MVAESFHSYISLLFQLDKHIFEIDFDLIEGGPFEAGRAHTSRDLIIKNHVEQSMLQHWVGRQGIKNENMKKKKKRKMTDDHLFSPEEQWVPSWPRWPLPVNSCVFNLSLSPPSFNCRQWITIELIGSDYHSIPNWLSKKNLKFTTDNVISSSMHTMNSFWLATLNCSWNWMS